MPEVKSLPGKGPSLWTSLWDKLRADFLTNWRLVLLGITGVVLSVASGWTTYDGITNFTRTPVLSLMITFGIQGVMLVTAWLIGESFATGATGEDRMRMGADQVITDIIKKAVYLFLSILFLALLSVILAEFVLKFDTSEIRTVLTQNLVTIFTVLGSVLALALFLVLFSRVEIIGPYARGMRVILANLPLWIMFLSCMATSVFFSFDSLFSTIFPAEERKRAGELRAQGQITGIIADIDAQIDKRRKEAADRLFASKVWQGYEDRLNRLMDVVRVAPEAIEEQFIKKLQERQSSLAKQQESLTSARSLQNNLVIERDQLKASLERLEQQRPDREAEVDRFQTELRAKRQEIATRRAEAEAEAKGVGGTGRVGRGPIFRELNKVVTKLKIEISALNEQLKTAERALEELDRRRVRERARLVEIEQEIGKFKAQEQAAQEGIKVQESLRPADSGLKIDATGGLKTFEQELAKFRQKPARQTLTNIQQLCGQLISIVSQVPKLTEQVKDIDCDPGAANEVAARIFVFNDSRSRYQELCGKDAKLPGGSTDALLDFGQKCVLTSSLPSTDTQSYRNSLNRIALNRDDKAHRFVVTWNAFMDGNRLAYLALAIAVAIDALVFMSGLFGANAVVSPLADSPEARNRPIAQLHEIVDNALLPDKAYSAELVLNVMHPMLDKENTGYMASVNLNGLQLDQLLVIRKVLTAGASLGLIKHDEADTHIYFVRSELFEYLSSVRAREARLGNVGQTPAIPQYGEQHQQLPPGQSNIAIEDKEPTKLEVVKASSETDSNSSQKLLPHNPSPDIEFQDQKVDRRDIFNEFLKALDVTQTLVIRLEDMKLSDDPKEWSDRLNNMKRENADLAREISHIAQSSERKLKDVHASLREKYADNKDLIYLVDDFAQTFEEWLPGVNIWKAYEQSKRRAEDMKTRFSQMENRLQSSDEDQQRRANDLMSAMDEALENKIDGWLELEEATGQLAEFMRELRG